MSQPINEIFDAIERDLVLIGDAIVKDDLAKAVVPYGRAMAKIGELHNEQRWREHTAASSHDRQEAQDMEQDLYELSNRMRNITYVFERVAAKSC